MGTNFNQPGNLQPLHPDHLSLLLEVQRHFAQVLAVPLKDHPALKIDLTQMGQSPLLQADARAALKAKMREGYQQIAQSTAPQQALIHPRTQAHNRKSPYKNRKEEGDFRSDVVGEQIRVWRSLLPSLIRKFARIPDPRRAKSVSHKIAVVMMFGLLAFIFRLTSRREMNRELTGAVIFDHLKKLFPELDSIPHADTLSRVLEKLNPHRVEAIHIGLIQELIRKKKFKKLLIQGCLPVTVDGAQKLYRDGILQDARWCE